MVITVSQHPQSRIADLPTERSKRRARFGLLVLVLGGLASCSGDDGAATTIVTCSCAPPPVLSVGTSGTYQLQDQSVREKSITVAVLNDLGGSAYQLSVTNEGSGRAGAFNTLPECCRATGSVASTLELTTEERLLVFDFSRWGIPASATGADGGSPSAPPPLPMPNPCTSTLFALGATTFEAERCEWRVESSSVAYNVIDTRQRPPSSLVGGFLSRSVTRISDGVLVSQAALTSFTR